MVFASLSRSPVAVTVALSFAVVLATACGQDQTTRDGVEAVENEVDDPNRDDSESPVEPIEPGEPDQPVACPAPLATCGDGCVDLENNPTHCGGCGMECEETEYCAGGECLSVCGAGTLECGGNCIDPLASRNFCGARDDCEGENAGAQCAPDEFCHLGYCLKETLEEFVTVWLMEDESWRSEAGNKANRNVKLPLVPHGTYGFTVDWGDGTHGEVTSWDSPNKYHLYEAPGQYTVRIRGTISGWQFYTGEDPLDGRIRGEPDIGDISGTADKLFDIVNFGPLVLGDTFGQFLGARRLNITATDSPDLSQTTSLRAAFAFAFREGARVSLAAWDTSGITDMTNLFHGAYWLIDADVGGWNTEHVENMAGSFFHTIHWEGDLSGWNTASVTNMHEMFRWAGGMQPRGISGWDVGQVTDMSGMFAETEVMDDLSGWDTSSVVDMSGMFNDAESFDQDLGTWSIGKVERMYNAFANTGLSTDNYDALLIGWAAQDVQPNVVFYCDVQYSLAAQAARRTLIYDHRWSISDGGLAP